MTPKTIEIPTPHGTLLVPDSEEANRRFPLGKKDRYFVPNPGIPYPHGVPLCDPAWRFTIGAVAHVLWHGVAERLCPERFAGVCRECIWYEECDLSSDEMGARIEAFTNASACLEWAKKGKNDENAD